MFEIDTTDSEGMKGPFLSWTPKGSAEKGFAPRSWVLRDKTEDGVKTENMVPGFTQGCVLDLDDIKLGWERDRPTGGPERRWSASIVKMDARPDETKVQTQTGSKYAWSKVMAIRVAIGGGKTATWSQSGFAGYDAFMAVMKLAKAQYSANGGETGLLPLVQQTGITKQVFAGGDTYIPDLAIVKWVPRPACLAKEVATPDIMASAEVRQAPVASAPPVMQPAAVVPADIAF
jgi:hypothetical protein